MPSDASTSAEQPGRLRHLRQSLGPGLLLAAAAIGVSHLVQSTRAGADYGFGLLWIVLLVNLFKYPFLEYGPRYAVATGESMLDGYRRLGIWALGIYLLFTLGTMFAIQAALALVTASLAAELTGIAWSAFTWGAVILAMCTGLLMSGRYAILDGAVKWIVSILAVSTVIAVVAALWQGSPPGHGAVTAPSLWNAAGISFVIALMGWMPIPIDAAAWHSLWTLERARQTGYTPRLKEALLDFNIGYIGTAALAVGFLSLGALVMFGSGEDFAASGSTFARQLIALYTVNLGEWAYPVIVICAFTAMFSTTLTVVDAYPRVCRQMASLLIPDGKALRDSVPLFRALLVVIPLCSLAVLYVLGQSFTLMIDIATTLSFLTAPVLAWLNYRLVTAAHVPNEYRPPLWLRVLSWVGIAFLTAFALIYAYWRVRGG